MRFPRLAALAAAPTVVPVALLSVLALLLTGCAGAQGGSGSVEIRYVLWDANQLAPYQSCADAFHVEHPGITVKVEQMGWNDYWTGLALGMVGESAPDVFTDHLSKYGQYVENHQLEPIDEFVARDRVDTNAYFPGLADLWVGPDGKRYGLPKDWDTIALFYNRKMVTEAGLSAADLAGMTWNPADGGSFEKVLARLSVDVNGKHGDERGFDPAHVKTYGFGYDDTGASSSGQNQWSFLAASLGFQFTDKNPWGTHYNFDDPRFIQTIAWYRNLITKGYAPPLDVAVSGGGTYGVSNSDQVGAGRYALVPHGDWMISTFLGLKGVDIGIAPLPVGPSGARASMFNGLADSIWSGSQHKEEAWQWVKFLASPACQDIVGRYGVVFPALPSGTRIAKAKFQESGVDVTPFTVNVENKTTFPFPVSHHSADITAIMKPLFDSIFSFKAEPDAALTHANEQINALFQPSS
jgi:multiple sugar transport system substrate-binding protein